VNPQQQPPISQKTREKTFSTAQGNALGVDTITRSLAEGHIQWMAQSVGEYGLRPINDLNQPDSWGVAPGYGDTRPSALLRPTIRSFIANPRREARFSRNLGIHFPKNSSHQSKTHQLMKMRLE